MAEYAIMKSASSQGTTVRYPYFHYAGAQNDDYAGLTSPF
jgi:hypothetical protein